MIDKELLIKKYNENFENTHKKDGFFQAPGRVNLIGEHTDYNNGFVLPMAINRRIYVYIQLRDDDAINLYSIDLDRFYTTTIKKVQFNDQNNWSNYIIGVVSELKKDGFKLPGFNMIFTGDIPQGAGLSSSAALEVATVTALSNLNNFDISSVDKALIAQRAENKFVGVDCGIMDQYISCLGEKDHALLIDCDSYDYEKVPFKDKKYQILIIDSKVQRGLVDSKYNLRRQQCNNVVKFFNDNFSKDIQSLRDININELFRYQDKLNEDDYKRASHVLTENRRVLDFCDSIENKNYEKAGRLMYASHLSLKDDFEVSCPELDFLVDTAMKAKGVLGARMTGAGFGGCTVNLIEKDYKSKIVNMIKDTYNQEYKKDPDFYISNPAAGAGKF